MSAHSPAMMRLLSLVVLCAVATPALAQTASGEPQSRTELLEREQAEKARRLHPYEPPPAEVWVMRAEGALMGPPIGVYPWIGSVYSGGLLAAGPGFRWPYGRKGVFDTQGAISLRLFKLARATLHLPPVADGRVHVSLVGEIMDAPRLSFYGVGNDTTSDSKTTFLFRPTRINARVSARPVRWVDVGASLESLSITTGAGSGTSIANRFTPVTAPGLGTSPSYTVAGLSAGVDWRDSPGYSRRGGLYRVDWSSFSARDDAPFTFRRADIDLRQMIPVVRANWVFAFRAAASLTSAGDGHDVPFFLMPQLGGSSDLRGYPSWRFRDRQSLLLTAEYRWTPSHFVDMAVFIDAGRVTARRADLDLADLKRSYGIGIRFHAPAATVLRLELARGDEGFALIFAFGPCF